MSPDGDKIDLPLEDAKKLLFDYEGDSDILFDDKFLKWNLTNKNLGQWDISNPENFDTNDPRMKLQRINTGCPTGCYYPNRGFLFQVNTNGLENLEFLGVYDSPFVAGIYGMEKLQKLIYLEIVRSHTSLGYGTFIEYPLIASIDEYIPFYSFPPNLLFLNVSGNTKILKFINLPETIRAINASDTGISSVADLQSANSDNKFPQLKILDLSKNKNLYTIDGIDELTPGLVNLKLAKCGMLGKVPKIPDTVEEFDISNNLFTSLTNLPSALKEFSGKQNKLLTLPIIPATTRIVDLQGNPLDEWSLSSVGNLSTKEKSTTNTTYNLEVLNISNSNNLPEGLDKFTNLKTLVANDTKIDAGLVQLPSSLETVELNNTGLQNLDGLQSCSNLKKVKASDNKIISYTGILNSKTTISELILNYNNLTDGDLSVFENVKILNVGDNNLNSFKAPNADEINFVGNPLTSAEVVLTDDEVELNSGMSFPIDLSLVTGNLDLNLDDSSPPKFKLQKNTLSPLQKINVLKSLSSDQNLSVKLTSNNMPLPNKTWWEQTRIVELKGGGNEINSNDTSKIPSTCSIVELKSTALSEFNDIPSEHCFFNIARQ